jgi:hypothetical protein
LKKIYKMDTFSLYEFLSFFLPGVLAAFLIQQLLPNDFILFQQSTELVNGLIFTIASLVIGLAIHRVTFLLLAYKWYKMLSLKPIGKIVHDNPENIKVNFDKINAQFNEDGLEAGALFDKAYYYLEYKERIAPAKVFQSMYFFLRNLITFVCLYIPLLITVLLFGNGQQHSLIVLLLCIGVIPILALLVQFYRMKMVERIFNTFYIAMLYKNEE